jgi:hypothetical protein
MFLCLAASLPHAQLHGSGIFSLCTESRPKSLLNMKNSVIFTILFEITKTGLTKYV